MVIQDPLAKLPVGLERMRHDDLRNECLVRGLWSDPGMKMTRPQMIILIREGVGERKSGWTSETQNEATPMETDQSRPSTTGRSTRTLQRQTTFPQAWNLA